MDGVRRECTPNAGHGEVRVKLEASGVNPSDTHRRRGPPTMEYPRVITNSDGAGVIDQVAADDLQGDDPLHEPMFRLVDNPHASATELFDDAVVRDGLADHGYTGKSRMVGGITHQVNGGCDPMKPRLLRREYFFPILLRIERQ